MISRSFVLVALGALSTGAWAVNIINNASFEAGLGGWSQTSYGGTWTTSATTFHSGTRSASIAGNAALKQSFAPRSTAFVVEASLWLKTDDTSYGTLVNLHYSDGSSSTPILFSPDTEWRKWTFTLDTGKSLTGIEIFGTEAGAGSPDPVVWVDDVTVDVVPEPATLAALGIGLLALRRRTKRS